MASQNLAQLAGLVRGKPWGEQLRKHRIYMGSGKSNTIYFEFPDADGEDLGGARLRVYIETPGQPAAWYAGQKKRIMKAYLPEAVAIMFAQAGNVSTAEGIIDEDIELREEDIDDVVQHLINGREREALDLLEGGGE